MFTATKEFKRDMAHRLPTHWWKCFNVHWHTYRALITIEWMEVQSEWYETGMLKDFSNFAPIKEWIDENRDHSYVWQKDDEVLEFLTQKWFRTYAMEENPTAENMSKVLYWMCKILLKWCSVKSVRIYETPTSYAEYSEDLPF